MNLGVLNETVILIDTNFLNERITENLTFYKKLYPEKNFNKINITDLLYIFALNARIDEAGHNVDILFAHTLDNSQLVHCNTDILYDFIDINQVRMETNKGTFLIRSFFADEEETCSEHFVNMLTIVNYSPRVSRIIMVADSPELNYELEMMQGQDEKSLFLIKKYNDSNIHAPIKYVNVDYPIAYALGLKKNEL